METRANGTSKDGSKQDGKVIPLFGRDEMNLTEFPFGPITAATSNTLDVAHVVFV